MTRRHLLPWLCFSIALFAVLSAFDAQLAFRTLQKLTNVSLFGWLGWLFSRTVFSMLSRGPHGELESMLPEVMDAVVQGRSIIIAGAMIAGALGL